MFKMSKDSISVKYFLTTITIVLFLCTILTMPRIDFAEPNVFFYLQNLPPLYYVCLFFSLSVALYFKRGTVSLIAAIIFGLLLLWTPSIMVVQLWPMDTFPFLGEAVYVTRTGYASTDVLGETPGLGLFAGSFMSLTGLDPFLFAKIYPAFFTVIFVTFLYLIGKELGLEKVPVLVPLLSVAVMWPNEIHLSRQCFSLIFYVVGLFLFLKLMKKRDRRILSMLLFTIILLVISHPVSSIFFMTSLGAIIVLGSALRKLQSKDVRLILSTIFFTAVSWIVWNAYCLATSKGLDVIIQLSQSFMTAILKNPTEISGVTRIVSGYTPIYSAIINLRLGLTIFVGLGALVFSVIIFWYSKNKKNAALTISWLAPGAISAVLLLYVGLPFMARPALFFFISWAPIGAWIYNRLDQKRLKNMKMIFVALFIILPALLLPVIKYASLPFTFATSQELAAVNFTSTHYNGSRYVYLEASPPYGYIYVVYDVRNVTNTITMDLWYSNEGLDQKFVTRYPTLVTYRLLTRDAFWEHNPSMSDVVANLTLHEPTLDKVYDSGWPYSVFTPYNPSND
jgi:hypothetical protein